MIQKVLLDTGPLVAALNRRDKYHSWAKSQLASISPPLLTCEAVLSETCFLLQQIQNGSDTVIKLLNLGLLKVAFSLEAEAATIEKLLVRYRSVPMSLADACLVRMAEQYGSSVLLTLDSDFKIYRKHGRQVIPIIMPEEIKNG